MDDEARVEIAPHAGHSFETGEGWRGNVTLINVSTETASVAVLCPPGPVEPVRLGMMEARVIDHLACDGTLTVTNESDATISVILRRASD